MIRRPPSSTLCPCTALYRSELSAKAPGDSAYAKVATDSSPSASASFSYHTTAGDVSYRFYTLATDKAGNGETAPGSADSETLLDTAKPASAARTTTRLNSTHSSISYTASYLKP